ncbi:hypothetical protein B0A68_11685 [Flavobacterium reichenbachii]|uniref:Uncharacterized protein n=1 Tax=Flavobacterium reichenbachii TaxID=362418 RepID=A0A085ZNQ3_9FLAO|nr:hypothetical protein IW19_11260 [Flavobacterium reichenbachii]OXB14708.1 hypothetical protein B0A68_11685 [Flavobacterium reichenbachii]
MYEINLLIKISKSLQRLAYVLFLFIWGEVLFYFTNYSSPRELFYKAYGADGISLYLGSILFLIIILSVLSKRVSDIADRMKKTELKK